MDWTYIAPFKLLHGDRLSFVLLYCEPINEPDAGLDKCYAARRQWGSAFCSKAAVEKVTVARTVHCCLGHGEPSRLQPVNGARCVRLCICVSSTLSFPPPKQHKARAEPRVFPSQPASQPTNQPTTAKPEELLTSLTPAVKESLSCQVNQLHYFLCGHMSLTYCVYTCNCIIYLFIYLIKLFSYMNQMLYFILLWSSFQRNFVV